MVRDRSTVVAAGQHAVAHSVGLVVEGMVGKAVCLLLALVDAVGE